MGPRASEFHWLDWRGWWKRLAGLTDGAQNSTDLTGEAGGNDWPDLQMEPRASEFIPLTWLARLVETTGQTYQWGREHLNWSDPHCRGWWKQLARLTNGVGSIWTDLTHTAEVGGNDWLDLPMGPGALEFSWPRLELPKPFCMPRLAVSGGKTLGVTVV